MAATSPASMTQPGRPSPRLYFAYGSNLSPTQMTSRCPTSTPVALGFLPDWKFIVNERGYANIIPDRAPPASATPTGRARGVYGLVYELGLADEEMLDMYEGVPDAYEKVEMLVQCDVDGQGTKESSALVYIDQLRVMPSKPRKEYVCRMNRGIEEAVAVWQLPEWYVEEVMRGFIPAVVGI